MTSYDLESFEWIEERIAKLLKEVDMLYDIKDKLIEFRRLKYPNPANDGRENEDYNWLK